MEYGLDISDLAYKHLVLNTKTGFIDGVADVRLIINVTH